MTTSQPPNLVGGLPPAGTSIGAAPGQTRTVTAEEIGFDLVNRCAVSFFQVGEQVPVRGRLVELVQPRPESRPPEGGLEEPTTLYVAPDGAKGVVPFPVPTITAVTVTVDPPSDPPSEPDGPRPGRTRGVSPPNPPPARSHQHQRNPPFGAACLDRIGRSGGHDHRPGTPDAADGPGRGRPDPDRR